MSDLTEFPFPADATDDERATARREIGAAARIVDETPQAIRFEGRLVGRTGPVHHFQYTRVYAIGDGFLAAGHDLRTGITVVRAATPERIIEAFANHEVREFVADELRFRGLLGAHA